VWCLIVPKLPSNDIDILSKFGHTLLELLQFCHWHSSVASHVKDLPLHYTYTYYSDWGMRSRVDCDGTHDLLQIRGQLWFEWGNFLTQIKNLPAPHLALYWPQHGILSLTNFLNFFCQLIIVPQLFWTCREYKNCQKWATQLCIYPVVLSSCCGENNILLVHLLSYVCLIFA
jgi:hypothetical protein